MITYLIRYYCPPGILVTGGNNGNNDAGGTAELLHSNGSSWCSLPALPDMRARHTQAGLEACGTDLDPNSDILYTCITFSAGSWVYSHQLEVFRYGHVSWSSPAGVVLMGGAGADQTSELLSDNSETSTIYFPLKYRTL